MISRLLTLLLLVLAAWWLYDVAVRADEEHAADAPAEGGLLFPGLESRNVDFVSLRFRTGHVLDVEREPEGPWRITYPTDELAQEAFVEALVDNLARATFIPIEEQGDAVRPQDVGLLPRQRQITFREGGVQHTVYLGQMDVFGKGAYAQRGDDGPVLLVTPNLLTMVEQFRDQDYVDKHLLRGLRGPVDHVRVERKEGVLLDAVVRGNRWVLREPVPGAGDTDRIRTLVRTLQFVQQLYPADVDPTASELAALGLPDPQQAARGELAGSTLVLLGSGAEEPARLYLEAAWAERDDETFCVRGDLAKILVFDRHHVSMLLNEPEFFRQRRVLDPIQGRARGVAIERAGETLLAASADEGGAWTFEAPPRLAGQALDSERVEGHSQLSELLGRIDGLSAAGFADEPPAGEPDATLSVRFGRSADDERDTLAFFLRQEAGEHVVATSSQRPGEVLLLARPDVEALLDPSLADRLQGLAPVHVDESAWTRLEIEAPGQPRLVVERASADGSWQGDDEWGRRYGLGLDVLRGLRGLAWQVAPAGVEHPWRLRYLAADGALLGELALRLPGRVEPPEAQGRAIAWASWSPVPGMELAVPREVLQRFDELARPQERR